jgi:protein-S-isoprenylcysteine O-methyltransferase Ste14
MLLSFIQMFIMTGRSEGAMLTEMFGADDVAYTRHTWRLLPGVY